MKRRWFAALVFALACVTVVSITSAPTDAIQTDLADASFAGTCETKHCSPNTHCCYGCTANPICVKNGVPCPECAPQ
jgi:hypothetical protein